MEKQKAFIATENYIKNVSLPFGVGVVTSFDEEDAMRCTTRRKNLATQNEWLDIKIPARSSFLRLDVPLYEHGKETLAQFFSPKSLSLLFYAEGQKYFTKTTDVISGLVDFPEEKKEAPHEEVGRFYAEKRNELERLPSVHALVQFITEKTRNRDLAVTSSFLQMVGINGIIFSEDETERALIFDARNQIEVLHFNSERL